MGKIGLGTKISSTIGKIVGTTTAVGAGGYVGWHLITGQGLDGAVLGLMSRGTREKLEEEGGIGAVKHLLQGKKGEEQTVAEQLLDVTIGNDNINKAKNAVEDSVRQVTGAVSNAVSPQSNENYQMHPEAMNAVTSDYSSVGGLLDGIFSGKGLGIGAMIAGLFMTFGRMGWLGKIAGLLTMGLGYNGITRYNESQRMQQRLQYLHQQERSQQSQQQPQQRTASDYYENMNESNENITVNRQRK